MEDKDKGKVSIRHRTNRPQPYQKLKPENNKEIAFKKRGGSPSKEEVGKGVWLSARKIASKKSGGSPSKEEIGKGVWLSARKARFKNPPDFILNPKDDTPSSTREESVKNGFPLIDTTNNRGKRYCCPDCAKWYQGSPLYASDEIHLSRTGRHKQPRPVTPPGFWEIGFPEDSD